MLTRIEVVGIDMVVTVLDTFAMLVATVVGLYEVGDVCFFVVEDDAAALLELELVVSAAAEELVVGTAEEELATSCDETDTIAGVL